MAIGLCFQCGCKCKVDNADRWGSNLCCATCYYKIAGYPAPIISAIIAEMRDMLKEVSA